jgi:hypothetical protein
MKTSESDLIHKIYGSHIRRFCASNSDRINDRFFIIKVGAIKDFPKNTCLRWLKSGRLKLRSCACSRSLWLKSYETFMPLVGKYPISACGLFQNSSHFQCLKTKPHSTGFETVYFAIHSSSVGSTPSYEAFQPFTRRSCHPYYASASPRCPRYRGRA